MQSDQTKDQAVPEVDMRLDACAGRGRVCHDSFPDRMDQARSAKSLPRSGRRDALSSACRPAAA